MLEDQPELILEDTEPRDTEPKQFMPDTSDGSSQSGRTRAEEACTNP